MSHKLDEKKSINFGIPNLIASLRNVLGNRFLRYFLRNIGQKELEWILGVYSGLYKTRNYKEEFLLDVISKTLSKVLPKFGVKEEALKRALKDGYMRKGVANILMGIAENGITRPQMLHAPFMVVWDFTRQCNLRCKHCYAEASPEPAPDELSLKEKLEVLRQLDEAGVAAISFSGGEPLINKDFWIVAKKAAELGFYVSVATNGTLLTPTAALKLKKIGVRYVEISLDSSRPEEHDEFRGLPGAWRRAVEGIINSKNAGLSVGIATTVTKINYKRIPELISLARKLRVEKFIAFNFIPTGRGKEIMELDLSPEEREKLLNYLYEELISGDLQVFSTAPMYAVVSVKHAREGKKITPTHFAELSIPEEYIPAGLALAEFLGGCGAGRIYCSIEQNGDIQPCVFLPIRVGNVIKDGFLNVWKNSPIMKKLRDRDNYGCTFCQYRYICGGCRARAYAYYGDITAPDPSCSFNEVLWKRILATAR
ncbi:MAG: radical SAM/SPASM domain-containing protein [Thermoproteota archaeon]|nr:MAG: radical SAM/SPASM domain-containing protein [Candidatus Korarchaeota archaeon]